MISILRRVRGGGWFLSVGVRSSCLVSLGLEYGELGAYSQHDVGGIKVIPTVKLRTPLSNKSFPLKFGEGICPIEWHVSFCPELKRALNLFEMKTCYSL